MSEDERLELVDRLRYRIIDVLDITCGRRVAALVFGAAWGSPALWSLPWGVLLGWIPAALLAIALGYVCR